MFYLMNRILRAKQKLKPLLPRWLMSALRSNGEGTRRGTSHYEYDPEDTVIADFAEFASQPIPEIVAGIRQFRRLVQRDWRELGTLSFEEASKKFYSQSQAYVFDLLSGNPNRRVVLEKLDRFSPAIVSGIRQHTGRRFLEFGGGLGLFCEIVAGFGKEVTYLDIPGRVSEFAAWRFQKYGLPVRTIIKEAGCLDGLENYDIIYTDAVLEHMPYWEQQRVVKALGDHVSAGGILVLLVDLSGPTAENPTHEVVDIDLLHSTLEGTGLRCQEGRGKFWSLWQR